MSDYPAFRKIPRLYREVIVTEKIDGTNGLVHIEPCLMGEDGGLVAPLHAFTVVDGMAVSAGSRKRWLAPGKEDNFGFAGWVSDNAEDLVRVLGQGMHYGEWWGAGIQRRYGLDHKRFSLFNTSRWTPGGLFEAGAPGELDVVPVLEVGTGEWVVEEALAKLRDVGSFAAPTFRNPEGVVVYHTAANAYFKATLDDDGQPKGAANAA
jgi:hypothetical protein